MTLNSIIYTQLTNWVLGLGALAVAITAILKLKAPADRLIKAIHQRVNRPAMDRMNQIALEQNDALRKILDSQESLTAAIAELKAGQKFTQVSQRMAMDAQGLMYVVCDQNGNATEISPTLVNYMGVPESRQKGKGYLNLIPAEHHERIEKEAGEALRFLRDYSITYPVTNAKGEEVMVNTYARFGGGDWFLIITVLEVISQKKHFSKTG